MKLLSTSKLFYEKWNTRIILVVPDVRENCIYGQVARVAARSLLKSPMDSLKNRGLTNTDLQKILVYRSLIKPLLHKYNIKHSTHGSKVICYLSDKTAIEEIKNNLKPWIYSITSPSSDEDTEFLEKNPKKILRSKLPHGKFSYKILIKRTTPTPTRTNFLQWIDNYPTTMLVNKKARSWNGNYKYGPFPYVYVSDEKYLLVVQLYLGQYIEKIENYVVKEP